MFMEHCICVKHMFKAYYIVFNSSAKCSLSIAARLLIPGDMFF